MKLLVVSHACVTAVNQSFYVDVQRLSGWDVEIALPASWMSEYIRDLKPSRWPEFTGRLHPIATWKSGNIPLHVYRSWMIGLLRKVRPDVIYVHHEPYGLATAQMCLANQMSVRVPIGFYAAQNIRKNYPIPFCWLEQYVMRQSSFCFPVAQGALDVVRSKGYAGLATVLPLPLDKSIYHPKTEWAHAQRARMGIPADEFIFGYVGRLVEEKGLATTLHAMSAIRDRSWRFVLVGSGPYQQTLLSLATSLGIADRLVFAGFVPHEDAAGWLSLFDALILASESRPNWKEQFGRVIVEANACGTPVIGTESGEIGNVLRETSGGLIVPEADPGALSGAMFQLLESPVLAAQLGGEGAANVRDKFDQQTLACAFVRTLQSATQVGGN
jgi:glycosyltransferase involved in cell wall biosynthesis